MRLAALAGTRTQHHDDESEQSQSNDGVCEDRPVDTRTFAVLELVHDFQDSSACRVQALAVYMGSRDG